MNDLGTPMEGSPLITPSSTDHPLYNSVVDACRTVFDPEIPVNIYDLGLIYDIITEDNYVKVKMTLTSPNCPVAGTMPQNVGNTIANIQGLKSIKVELIWEPKWNKDMMSEEAKLALDIF